MSQLAGSGAPVGCVVLNGKQYEPDSLKPLLVDVKENHPALNIDKVNGDGIFNSQACRDTIREILGNDAELFASVNLRNKKDIENPAKGIAKITKCGNVQCMSFQHRKPVNSVLPFFLFSRFPVFPFSHLLKLSVAYMNKKTKKSEKFC